MRDGLGARRWRRTAALLGATAAWGCGAGGVSYSGARHPRVVEPLDVVSADRAPAGHEKLGSASAGCTPLETERDAAPVLDEERQSDVSCSPELLVGALRDMASDAGGDHLLGLECSAAAPEPGEALSCDADVWGPPEGAAPRTSGQRPLNVDPRAPAAPGAPPIGAVTQAWSVYVELLPRAGAPVRAARSAALVERVDFPRVSEVLIGDVVARCESECAEASLVNALAAGAAHAGATTLVDVRCFRDEDGQACVAGAAAPRVEPTLAEVR